LDKNYTSNKSIGIETPLAEKVCENKKKNFKHFENQN
jgi:hypothetical protein